MNVVDSKPLLAAAALLIGGMTAAAFAQSPTEGLGGISAAGKGAQLLGSGRTTTLNCSGKEAQITGSKNTVTLTGGCTNLKMLGSNNVVNAELGANARIEFVGSNNTLTWSTPDGEEPKVQSVGKGNTLTKRQ